MRANEVPVAVNEDRDEDECKTRLTQWTDVDSGTYVAIGSTVRKLRAGVYRAIRHRDEPALKEVQINVDELIDFKDGLANEIMMEVHSFWDSIKSFHDHGFLHKRGYLLYGPAGGGKTCLVNIIMNDVRKRDGIVLLCNGHPPYVSDVMEMVRKVEPKRLILCVFEDIDSIIEEHGEARILSILDGESQINHVLNIATTNYPEKLDKRIVSRPRRFDRIVKIGMPRQDVREKYFKSKAELTANEAVDWAKKTDKFSFGALADLVISVKCLGTPLDAAIERLDTMRTAEVSSKDFGSDYNRDDHNG